MSGQKGSRMPQCSYVFPESGNRCQCVKGHKNGHHWGKFDDWCRADCFRSLKIEQERTSAEVVADATGAVMRQQAAEIAGLREQLRVITMNPETSYYVFELKVQIAGLRREVQRLTDLLGEVSP